MIASIKCKYSSANNFTVHRLICPICENVIWIVDDKVLGVQPTEKLSTPGLELEGTIAIRSHKKHMS